jgi:flagellar protein FliS
MSLAARYKAVQVETASPPRLMMMLFDGAMRNMAKGKAALAAGDADGALAALERASAIVLELDSTLKDDAAPGLSPHLHDVYHFVVARLAHASVVQDARPVEEAERVLAPIVEAFGQAAAQVTAGAAR